MPVKNGIVYLEWSDDQWELFNAGTNEVWLTHLKGTMFAYLYYVSCPMVSTYGF